MRQGRTILVFILLVSAASGRLPGQSRVLTTPALDAADAQGILPSNSVSHLVVNGTSIWIGGSKGLALSTTGGAGWTSFASNPAFARPGIFAVAARQSTIWASTGYTKDVEGTNVQTGSGYAYSLNNGATWTGLPQTLDARGDSLVTYGQNTVRFLPIVVPEQNVTFDIALSDSAVWITSWSSGLRKSTDRGATWKRIVLPSRSMNSIAPTDSLGYYAIDPRKDNNYLLFSVAVDNNDTVWAGSAGGVNKSTDGGESWTKFSRNNQSQPILGDWVIAIAIQRHAGSTRVWTTNWPADGANQRYGISVSENGGATWKNFLQDIKAYSFAFRDSVVYVATDDGLYRTDDDGRTWNRSGSIVDAGTGQRVTTSQFFSVAVMGDSVYGGTSDGFVKTLDNAQHPFASEWTVDRAYQSLPSASSAYAYPNPFSPRFESCRVHYSTGGVESTVTIEIFDFGMNRLRTLIKDAPREGSREHDELWNGLTDAGVPVTNGVYFYRVIVGGGDPVWGKIMVLQ